MKGNDRRGGPAKAKRGANVRNLGIALHVLQIRVSCMRERKGEDDDD